MTTRPEELQLQLGRLLSGLYPGASISKLSPLAADEGKGPTEKALGYGRPLLVELRLPEGGTRRLVFRTQAANEYGHDRRADRAEAVLLSFDTFGLIPLHVRALDAGVIREDGLLSVRQGGEFYLVTEYSPGHPYAGDLRRVASEGRALEGDLQRVDRLASYLSRLHQRLPGPGYRRAVRDLLGHGEGIFGIIDGYPSNTAGAPLELLRGIEERCLSWRWRLREFEHRLCRTHGDFHPFNVLFDEGSELRLLDASRGCQGEAADDLTAMAVNYVFFAIDAPSSWRHGLGSLWRRLWRGYLDQTGDRELLAAAPPFFTWRALVVCSPRFYPSLSAKGRSAMLELARHFLDLGRLDPEAAEGLFP